MRLRLTLTRFLVLPLVGLALTTGPAYPPGSLVEAGLRAAGAALLVLAAGGRIWASLYVAGKKNGILVMEGPYSLTRNPLYFFSLLGFIGAGFAFGSALLALAFTFVFFLSHWPTILAEERALGEIFGADYARYREAVPRFLPRVRGGEAGEIVAVNPRKFVLSLREAMAIPLTLVATELVRWAQGEGLLPILLTLP